MLSLFWIIFVTTDRHNIKITCYSYLYCIVYSILTSRASTRRVMWRHHKIKFEQFKKKPNTLNERKQITLAVCIVCAHIFFIFVFHIPNRPLIWHWGISKHSVFIRTYSYFHFHFHFCDIDFKSTVCRTDNWIDGYGFIWWHSQRVGHCCIYICLRKKHLSFRDFDIPAIFSLNCFSTFFLSKLNAKIYMRRLYIWNSFKVNDATLIIFINENSLKMKQCLKWKFVIHCIRSVECLKMTHFKYIEWFGCLNNWKLFLHPMIQVVLHFIWIVWFIFK